MIWRYEHKEIRDIWTPTATYARWFDVEVAALREIDPALADAAVEIGPPPQRLIAHHEGLCGHDVMAFLRAWDETIEKGSIDKTDKQRLRAAMHFGLTSSDIVDTALARAVLDSTEVVDQLSRDLAHQLYQFRTRLVGKQTVGRTHGQLAAVMPAAHRWKVLEAMLHRTIGRVYTARPAVRLGKLSGPVGIAAKDSEQDALGSLGLDPILATQLVPRDGLAHLAHTLAGLATVAEAIVTQAWLLAQSGVGEVRLSGLAVGSSAMPHKDNPVACETIRGLARMVRAHAETLQLGVIQWGEHDMAHSSVERVALPDMLHMLCTILERTAQVVSHLRWTEPAVPQDYRDTGAVLRSAQAAGVPWADAHDAVRRGQLTLPVPAGTIPGTTTITEETK